MATKGRGYRGPLGSTKRERLQYVCPSGAEVSVEVATQVNATTDMDLVGKLLGEDGPPALTDPATNETCSVFVRRIFHDPQLSLFVLVLTNADRHRELEARAELLGKLSNAGQEIIPAYVRNFAVVYGGDGLARFLASQKSAEKKAKRAAAIETRSAEIEKRQSQFDAREKEFGLLQKQLEAREAAHGQTAEQLAAKEAELQGRTTALKGDEERLARATAKLKAAQKAAEQVVAAAKATDKINSVAIGDAGPRAENYRAKASSANRGVPQGELPVSEARTAPFALIDESSLPSLPSLASIAEEDDDYEAFDAIEPEEIEGDEVVVADQLVEDAIDRIMDNGDSSSRPGGVADVAIERWVASREPSLATVDQAGRVRLALSLPSETLSAMLSAELKVMLQLHRFPTHPVVTLSVGNPKSFSEGRPPPATAFFNVANAADSAVLEALARDFTFQVDLFDTEYLPVRKRTITAALSDNAHYVLAAASEALAKLRATGEPSYSRAVLAYDDRTYDRFGRQHPERKEFREDILADLSQPSKVRWAIHVCRRFSSTQGLAYLFYVRGYPLKLWKQRRRAVLERAIELGLWVGNTLGNIAVAEGVIESRKYLVSSMAQNFVTLVAVKASHDLDDGSVRDNWTALTEELTAQGFDAEKFVSPKTETISSELRDVASGTIGSVTALSLTPPAASPKMLGNTTQGHGEKPARPLHHQGPLAGKSLDQLIALLGDRDRRFEAALQLCELRDPISIDPLFTALAGMTRAEAGDVFGGVVAFGEKGIFHLVETLASRKGFLRQGAALALSALKAEAGIAPVCDLLVSEPTDIWKEVARALGEYGRLAISPLAAKLRGQSEVAGERVAWALAHIASRSERGAVENLAGGSDPTIAGVARHALELADLARSDNRSIWNPKPGREHTVKRAFSKRIFDAIPNYQRDNQRENDLSGPALALSDADLMDAHEFEDDVEALDESDLLPS